MASEAPAAPVPTDTGEKRLDFEVLREAHIALMRAYDFVLRDAAKVRYRHEFMLVSFSSWGSLWVRSHVRKHAKLIAASYIQLIQTVDADAQTEPRLWLRTAIDGCNELADALRGPRWPNVIPLLPPLVALAAKIHGVSLVRSIIYLLTLYGVMIVGYAFIYATGSFHQKRAFFTSYSYYGQPDSGGNTVYFLEDRLYQSLRRPKPPEVQSDLVAYLAAGATAVATAEVAIVVFLTGVVGTVLSIVVFLIGVVGYIVLRRLNRGRDPK
jgi:hypothetical protein